MLLTLSDIEPAFTQLLERGELELLFGHIANLSGQLSTNDALKGRALFLPQLDALLQRASATLVPPAKQSGHSNTIIHVATEIYETGGHTRVIEDMVRSLPGYRHILILTDFVQKYKIGALTLGILQERFKTMKLEVLYLRSEGLLPKTKELAAVISAIAPKAVFIFNHHFDVIANAGVAGHSAPRVIYIHHCDHNPALGASRTDFIHVDPSPACHEHCKAVPDLNPTFLGLSVEDKEIIIPFADQQPLIGATCGSAVKFMGRMDYSYGELLAALFAGGITRMYHIGDMAPQLQEGIKAEIRAAGQDAERVVFLPNTPSLAEKLKELSPAFFMISHPVAGGKATVEAMSLGLPLIFPRPVGSLPLLCWDMSMGNAIVIEKLADAPAAVTQLQQYGQELGHRSRVVFDEQYAAPVFHKRIAGLLE